MPQADQTAYAQRIDAVARNIVTRIATLVATKGQPAVLATLDRVTVDSEARAMLIVPRETAGALIPHTKQIVAIMAPGAQQFMGERAPVQTMPDEPGLPLTAPSIEQDRAVLELIAAVAGGPGEQTLPESLETLHRQQKALMDGRRHAQMFPTGTPELPLPLGMERLETPRGIFHFNPQELDPVSIIAKSAEARENEILGYGPYSKIDVMTSGQPPICVVERGKDGVEIVAVLTTQAWSDEVMAAWPAPAPNSVIQIEPLPDVIRKRMAALEAPANTSNSTQSQPITIIPNGGAASVHVGSAVISGGRAGAIPGHVASQSTSKTTTKRGGRRKAKPHTKRQLTNGHDPEPSKSASQPKKTGSPFQ